MRHRIGNPVGLAITLLLTSVLVAAAADTPRRVHSSGASALLRALPFNVSGQYTGTLGGDIVLDGYGYRLSPNVSIYEIGVGQLPAGTPVQDRYVYFSGLRTNRGMLVYGVIVRPAGESTPDGSDLSSHISIRDEGAAR